MRHPPPHAPPGSTPAWRVWGVLALGYLALALVLSWPLGAQLGSSMLGYPSVDALDTVLLRGVVGRMFAEPGQAPWTDAVYFPVGYPVLHLVPNLLDHALGALVGLALPFPASDNAVWLLTLTANGLAGHRLGQQLGGPDGHPHGAGLLAGVIWASSDAVLREANLHHAPQALVPWPPLFLAALLRVLDGGGRREGLWLGLYAALSGLTYWYYAVFLAFGAIPITLLGLWRRPAAWRPLAWGVVLAWALALPVMAPYLRVVDELPLADPAESPAPMNMTEALEPIPEHLRFVVEHGVDWRFPAQATPLDRSNRLSWVALGLALALTARGRAGPRWQRVGLWGLAAVGAVMVLGPYLKSGEVPVLWEGKPLGLPLLAFHKLHPFFARLTWPERWGLLMPLALAALACRAPRPGLWAALVLAEALLLSGNAPLQVTDLRWLEGWRALERAPGAVLELPLARGGLEAPLVGLHARYHGRDLVNPILLPPGELPPAAWKRWLDEEPLIAYLRAFESGEYPKDPGAEAVRSLREAGVAALAVDGLPGSTLTEGRIVRYINGLGKHLGRPVDYGSAVVWWIQPPDPIPPGMPPEQARAWRTEASAWLKAHPPPDPDTLIEPTWSTRKARPFTP